LCEITSFSIFIASWKRAEAIVSLSYIRIRNYDSKSTSTMASRQPINESAMPREPIF
jgi:hypothetical protein